MEVLGRIKAWIASLTEVGLMLLALAIVAGLLVGGSLPFFGGVVGNIITLVKNLGDAGLAGLITLGVILWLFNKRALS
jgi:ABC-type enterochelin transport system permease subunit